MYTILNPNAMWPLQPGATNMQGLFGQMPTLMLAAPSTVNQTDHQLYYQIQPAVYAPLKPANHSRQRPLSDDVFLPEGVQLVNTPLFNFQGTESRSENRTKNLTKFRKEPSQPNGASHKPTSCGSQMSNNSHSLNSSNSSSGHNTSSENSTPINLNSLTATSTSSSPSSQKFDDSVIQFLPSSLCLAINCDPPEPQTVDAPLKTSSPIQADNEGRSLLIDFSNIRKRRGREILSSSSEKCPRFSENGTSAELDQCDKILIRSRNPDSAEEDAKRREEFLLILEAERDRQKKIILAKNAPKMSCKFCRNNGESPEIYTKHRLHHNEKTVCPILRHYVCRLCNSTGDFAHTIRHCPFNDRKNKIAWKATFLV